MNKTIIYLSAFFLLLSPQIVSAKSKPKKPPVTKLPVTITYTGGGSLSSNSAYTQAVNSSPFDGCRIDTTSATETIDNVQWFVSFKNINLLTSGGGKAQSATFSGDFTRRNESAADLRNCPAFQVNSCLKNDPHCVMYQDSCTEAKLQLTDYSLPFFTVEKKKKNYTITVRAESGVDIKSLSVFDTNCNPSSAFDNAVLTLHSEEITLAKFTLKPADKKKTTKLVVPLSRDFDCADPARMVDPFLSETCTISSKLNGTLQISGKWTAKLVK